MSGLLCQPINNVKDDYRETLDMEDDYRETLDMKGDRETLEE